MAGDSPWNRPATLGGSVAPGRGPADPPASAGQDPSAAIADNPTIPDSSAIPTVSAGPAVPDALAASAVLSAPPMPTRWLPLPPAAPPQGPAIRPTYWVVPDDLLPPGVRIFRSARRRARIAAILLAAATVAAIVAGIHFFDGLGFLERARGGYATLGEALEFDQVTLDLGLVGLGLTIVTAIAFVAWQSRAVDNLGPLQLDRPSPPSSPRMSIVWWFVPFASYVMPYRIVADLQRRLVGQALERALVIGWWLAWLGQTAFGFVSFAIAPRADTTVADITKVWSIQAAGEFVRAISGVLAILVVMAVDRGMERRAARLAAGPTPPAMGPVPGQALPPAFG